MALAKTAGGLTALPNKTPGLLLLAHLDMGAAALAAMALAIAAAGGLAALSGKAPGLLLLTHPGMVPGALAAMELAAKTATPGMALAAFKGGSGWGRRRRSG